MKYFAKLVTGIVMMALLAVPMFAAVPCRPAAQSKTCCGGAACPMTAKTPGSKGSGHEGTNGAPTPCCKMTTQFLVAAIPQRVPEAPVTFAILRESFADLVTPFVRTLDNGEALIETRSIERSPAVLCTFLI